MSFFDRFNEIELGRENARTNAIKRIAEGSRVAAANQAPAVASTVFVEVGEQATATNITRGGARITPVEVSSEAIGSYLDGLRLVPTKVVTQSVAPGLAVARGTVIDIIIAQTDDLPIRVIPGVHSALADLTVAQVSTTFLAGADVRDILRRRTDPADLTSGEQEILTTALNGGGVQIAPEGVDDLGSAFKGLQAALTFRS